MLQNRQNYFFVDGLSLRGILFTFFTCLHLSFSCGIILPCRDFELITEPFTFGKLDCNFARLKMVSLKYYYVYTSRYIWIAKCILLASFIIKIQYWTSRVRYTRPAQSTVCEERLYPCLITVTNGGILVLILNREIAKYCITAQTVLRESRAIEPTVKF